ncbi:GTP cyclohydrolase II [Rhodovibrio salinarum]|uniref:GTP cyclohydrolase-2 n=1 Tax=Rhodovibrio salinarum TaxID=1087 RepID=A0A934QHJ3_9PROT|nr:GTP cyclohydrolase II [Rhodovibrio salinarum]MBK1696903.1 GTP cyclohydrolase II [Rhodovibrio salinarum]
MSQQPAQPTDPVPTQPLDAATRRRVDRAIGELRRGDPVLLTLESGEALLALAAEEAGPDGAQRLRAFAGILPALTVTAWRAAALGLNAPEGAQAVDLQIASDTPERTAAALLSLADPTAPAERSLPTVDRIATADLLATHALTLTKLGRLLPAVLAVPAPLNGQDPDTWASAHDLLRVAADDLPRELASAAADLHAVADARIPLAGAEDARVHAFRPRDGGPEHLAIVIGQPDTRQPVLVRLHSECFTGDLLGSLRCDCGDQLRGAIHAISEAGGGVLLYLAQEGRGIGLVNKLRAYRLQDAGIDTLDANNALGFDADERVFGPAAEMLRQLDIGEVRLLTNNPRKVEALTGSGIQVRDRVPHAFPSNGHNERYLATKAERFGHRFD